MSRLTSSYSDWIALNEPRLIILRRTTEPLDLSRYAEAIGDIMLLKLEIDTPTNRPAEGLPEIKSDIPTSNLLPAIKFHGSSEQHNGMNALAGNGGPSSFVRGVVQLTADDPPQVRWTLVIRYGGEDRWRLECVQVGGRGSRRGFFGVSPPLSVRIQVPERTLLMIDLDRCPERGTIPLWSSLVLAYWDRHE
jgi:hypothetical protein